jgi:hypothetical protein
MAPSLVAIAAQLAFTNFRWGPLRMLMGLMCSATLFPNM